MATRPKSETTRIEYLLGLDRESDRESIELEYFEDDDAFQEMLAAEEELIDAYARGQLGGEERQRFEERFLVLQQGSDRVRFARAFRDAVVDAEVLETRPSAKLSGIFKLQGIRWTRAVATASVVIVVVTVLSWLLLDHRRMSNELRSVRDESAELRKETEELKRTADVERTRAADITDQLEYLVAQSDKPTKRETGASNQRRIDQPSHEVNSSSPEIAITSPKTAQLPLSATKMMDLLTLRSGVSVAAGVDGNAPNTFALTRRERSNDAPIAIGVQRDLSWIRFQLDLPSAAEHTNYYATIKTTSGSTITSVDWIEPLTPNQKTIDTPVIEATNLPPGDYVLVLLGQDADGTFVKIADYSFKIMN